MMTSESALRLGSARLGSAPEPRRRGGTELVTAAEWLSKSAEISPQVEGARG